MIGNPAIGCEAVSFAVRIVQLASEFDFSVSSWGRSAKHNKDVGGEVDSRHLDFCACDVILEDAQNKQSRFLTRCSMLGIHYKAEADHIHLQDRGVKMGAGGLIPPLVK